MGGLGLILSHKILQSTYIIFNMIIKTKLDAEGLETTQNQQIVKLYTN